MENRPGTVDELTKLYRETIMKHAVAPVGFEADIEATHKHEIYNPLCGDRIEVLMKLSGDTIEAMSFKGEACAICMASASLMCENHSGTAIADFRETQTWLAESMAGTESHAKHQELVPLLGVKAYPSRVKCALLPWEAAEKALDS